VCDFSFNFELIQVHITKSTTLSYISFKQFEHVVNFAFQEKLAESRNKELDKDQRIDAMKNDYDSLDSIYRDTKLEVQKCEDCIEQLTQELGASQEELSMSQNRVKECEENIKNLRDKNGCFMAGVCCLFSNFNQDQVN